MSGGNRAKNWPQEPVLISMGLSCGCRYPKRGPLPMIEANVHPGEAVICDAHDEFAVVTRISVYLAEPEKAIINALVDSDTCDYDTAVAIAHEQTRTRSS